MGDSFEVLFWLLLFAVMALRGATRGRTPRVPSSPDEGAAPSSPRERPDAHPLASRGRAAGPAPPARREARRAPGRPVSPPRAGRGRSGSGGGLRGRWRELAREIERQLQAQAGPTPSSDPGSADTVLVPGRTVMPAPREDVVAAVSREAEGTARRPAPPASVPIARRWTRPVGAPGVRRLDRLHPLARGVLYAEILAPPPGLGGPLPADRRLEEF